MKTIRLTIITLLFISLITIGATRSPMVRTQFTGLETNLVYTDPGNTTVKDGRLLIRDQIGIAVETTTDPRVSGEVKVHCYCSIDLATISGPCHGTYHLVNSGGEWEGVWEGYIHKDGAFTIHMTGKGSGGYEGLIAKWTYVRLEPGNPNSDMSISGEIKEVR